MSTQTWLKTDGTRLNPETNETRPIRIALAIDNLEDSEHKKRTINECKVIAKEYIRFALARRFGISTMDQSFTLEEIEKPADKKLVKLSDAPIFYDVTSYELFN